MKCWLEIQHEDGSVEKREVTAGPGKAYGIVTGTCPGCEVRLRRRPESEFRIGTEKVIQVSHGLVKAGARCTTCGDAVGWCFAETDTIFGAEEDRAMLSPDQQRCRVYR